MAATEVLTTRMTPEIKERVTGAIREEFLRESIWLRRLVLRALQTTASTDTMSPHEGNGPNATRRRCSSPEDARKGAKKEGARASVVAEMTLPQAFPSLERLLHAKRCARHPVPLPDLFKMPLMVQVDRPHPSSDGGTLLLKACDGQLGLSELLARCSVDTRQASKLPHSFGDPVRPRLFGIPCGYPDCNDAARLAEDPIHKRLLGA